ncbi:hypothetical protein Vadar_022981 [Vaccinium darrowii]|uniref:Uncharacterized protein n=1 Tax=Vaccinium darrowii TaxID=229202 RepID=A0ACB7Y882_9ERIC|nr:hypothetical protein Vadar_022981 [Vaccinium darrowii]
MDGDGGDDDLQQTMGFTSEDFSELNDTINLTTTSSIEEISELYKSFNTTNDNSDNIEKEMPKVQKVESTRLKSLLNEEFSTRQELLDRVRNVAVMEGYVTLIKRSKADRKVVNGCDRGGKFRGTSVPMDERKKISATRLISCPFEMVGLKRVERFVNAWTSKHPHFGNRVTSRVESAHAMLKKYLTVSTGNFREELVTHVSVFALGQLFKQSELPKSDYVWGLCTGNFSRTMGLPCANMMREKKDGTLHLDDIHPRWRIDIRSFINMDGGVQRNGSEIECLLKNVHDKYKHMPLVQKEDIHKQIAQLVDAEISLSLEPNIQSHKGRPLGSKKRKGDCSTTRHLLAFEIVEKGRKCGVCHHVGHNSRTCPRKGEFNSSDPRFVLANQDVTLNMLETPRKLFSYFNS